MRRYWVPREAVTGQRVSLKGDVLHHIRDVCRMRKGSRFEVLVEGTAYLVEIDSETSQESQAQVIETRAIAPRPKPDIVLVLAIPRFPVFEAVIEKAVELGITRIQPVFSDYSFIKTKDQVLEKKRPRWEKIILSATQQSGRGDLMPIEQVQSLKDSLENFNRKSSSAGLFAYEGDGVLSAKQALDRIEKHGESAAQPDEVYIFVGAEGGFSHQEVELFQRFGLQPVTLGQQVLRVETACVALSSIIKYHFDQMR